VSKLYALLGVETGVTAVIGSGGKTTLLEKLCQELPGTVILCTSTRIYPFDLPLITERVETLPFDKVCMGIPAEHGKLAAPVQSFAELAKLADYVLVEADGSRHLPFKAHLSHEPVIPACARQTIQVVGTWALGRPVSQAVHRPERFMELSGCAMDDPVTPENLAKVLNAENLADLILLNGPENTELQKLLQMPSVTVSIE
jgi:probable selenium-dependent hydroxylase accessory protein YqeC